MRFRSPDKMNVEEFILFGGLLFLKLAEASLNESEIESSEYRSK